MNRKEERASKFTNIGRDEALRTWSGKKIKNPTFRCAKNGAPGFFGFVMVCALIRLVDDFASFHTDRGTMFLQPSNISGVVGRFNLFGNDSVFPLERLKPFLVRCHLASVIQFFTGTLYWFAQ
jgi:hypothetical protein